MKRIGLFILTNILVLVAFSVFWNVANYFYPLDLAYGSYYLPLLVFFGIWGMAGAFISLYMSKWVAKKYYGVQIISEASMDPVHRSLMQSVHLIARKAGLEVMPEVGIYDSPEVNAFATGPSKKNSLVAVSSGLLQNMDGESVQGVLAHEVAHIANGDMVTMTLIQGVINAFVLFFARILSDVVASQIEDEKGGGSFFLRMGLNIAFQVVFGFLGMIVVAFFSRSREYRADLGSAKTLGKRPMLKALESLQKSTELIARDKGAMATMKIASLPSLFSTHPSLEDRMKRLNSLVL